MRIMLAVIIIAFVAIVGVLLIINVTPNAPYDADIERGVLP